MDGTLCNVSDIRHYVSNGNRNFDKFHRASLFCPPNEQVVALHRMALDARYRVLIVTARERTYEQVTADWLQKHGLFYNALYMRDFKDYRKDYTVKSEILEQIYIDGYNPVLAVDDNPNVIQLWNERNIPSIIIPGWEPY